MSRGTHSAPQVRTAAGPPTRGGTAGPGVSFPGTVRAEWTKFRTVRSTAWSMLATIVLTIGLGALITGAQVAHWSEMPAAERARFDPTMASLSGVFLAQLAVLVLGVLVMTGEYSSGTIRATLAAVPRRLPVLGAKVVVFATVVFLASAVSALVAFVIGQSILAHRGVGTTLSSPGVGGALLGAAIYLTLVGLLGLGLGAVLRSTPGAISAGVAGLLVLPILANFLPGQWSTTVQKFLPGGAGQVLMRVHQLPAGLSPLQAGLLLGGYALVAVLAGAVVLSRRDA